MKTCVPGLWLLFLAALPGFPAAAQQAAPGGAPSGVRLAQPNAARFPEVTLYAYPVDERGVLIGGLKAEQFQVTENGRPAALLRVDSQGGSLDVCLALDCSLSMTAENKTAFARDAAREFLRQLGPEDQAALIGFADQSSLLQGLTRDRAALGSAVEMAQPAGSSTAFLDGAYWAVTQVALLPQAGSSVVGAAHGRTDARRVVVALTDGQDNASRVSAQQVIEYARANGVSLCMVALGMDAETGLLETLARQTGGVYLRAPGPQDLQRLYARLAEELRREYRLTVRSPQPEPDGARRNIRVGLAGLPYAGETWYQAPGRGSLLVTAPGASAAQGPGVVSQAPSGHAKLLLGALLVVTGLGGAVGGLFLWLGLRRRTLPIVDSNPRIDLLPLWVRDGSTLVGRGAECELVLDSHQVSRVHARIEAAGGIFLVFDEGSRNGTFVNGRRVRRSRELHVGDTLRFGDREFRFAGEIQS